MKPVNALVSSFLGDVSSFFQTERTGTDGKNKRCPSVQLFPKSSSIYYMYNNVCYICRTTRCINLYKYFLGKTWTLGHSTFLERDFPVYKRCPAFFKNLDTSGRILKKLDTKALTGLLIKVGRRHATACERDDCRVPFARNGVPSAVFYCHNPKLD